MGAFFTTDVQDDVSVCHQECPIAQLQCLLHIVCDHQAGDVFSGGDFPGQLEDFPGCARIQGGRVLIQQQKFWGNHSGHEQGQCLTLAAGECFDKVARVLGLGYPGGDPMDKLAQGGDDSKYVLPVAHVAGAELDMSFSGLKTASLNLIHNAQQKGEALDLPAFAASFGRAVSDSLVPRVIAAAKMTGYGKIAVAGGVAANSRVRADLQAACAASGDRLFLPELKYCGDNAAMIGCQGFYEFQAGHTAGWDLNAFATRDISLG